MNAMINLVKTRFEAFPRTVVDWCNANAVYTATKFCAYLECVDGDIVERCFATKQKKGVVKITEVTRTSVDVQHVIVKNLLYCYPAGYSAIYEPEDRYYRCGGYPYKAFSKEDFDKWTASDGRCGFSYITLNPEIIFTVPEYKYCGYSDGTGTGVISYLRAYKKDKNVEFLGKMGLSLSPILMNKAKKDGKFRKFLWDNHNGIALYGIQAALYAYKNSIDVEKARRICNERNQLNRLCAARIPEIKGTSLDRQRVLDYVDRNNINYTSYNDYLRALKALKYDLSDTKNIYPHDFKRMHDLRAAEYASHKAKLDRKQRAKFYRDFKRVSASLARYEVKGDTYSIVIPKDVSELIIEGETLSHCVGRMGYDKKMVDGVSLIMFCRKNEDVTTPFVTVEYRLDKDKLNQCYGAHDIPPDKDVMNFVEAWAQDVAKQRKKEQQNEAFLSNTNR